MTNFYWRKQKESASRSDLNDIFRGIYSKRNWTSQELEKILKKSNLTESFFLSAFRSFAKIVAAKNHAQSVNDAWNLK